MQVWSSIDTVDLSFTGVTGQLGSVDGDNYTDFIYIDSASAASLLTDGINPVIFDNDGAVTAAIFGSGNEYLVLGFAGISDYLDDTVTDGQAVINCKCLADHPTESCLVSGTTIEDSEDDLDFTIVHEMGHFLNLGHTQVNYDLFFDGAYVEGDMPIMFPVASGMINITSHEDDILSLTQLYPADTITNNYCLITGVLTNNDGEYLPCVDIWAVQEGNTDQTLSYVTASHNNYNTGTSLDFDINDTCDEYCGSFSLYVKPGLAYTLVAHDVYSSFVGGSSVGPCVEEQPTYGLEGTTVAEITAEDCPVATDTAIDAGTVAIDATGGSSGSSGGDSSSSSSSSGGGQSSSGTGTYNDALNPYQYGCALNANSGLIYSQNQNALIYFSMGLMLLFLYLRVRCCKRD